MSQILFDVSNELLNTHDIFVDLQCNDGYPGYILVTNTTCEKCIEFTLVLSVAFSAFDLHVIVFI